MRGARTSKRSTEPAGSGGSLLRCLPQARGQAAQGRQRRRLHADLPRGRSGRRPVPGAQLGGPASAQPAARGPSTAARQLGRRRSRRGGGDRPDRRRGSVRDGHRRASRRNGRRPADGDEAVHAARLPDRAREHPDEGPRRHARRAPVGRARGTADARRAWRLPPRGQPEGPYRLPALRERLALRARPPREARAARQRSELPADEQLRLQRQGVEDRRASCRAARPPGVSSA